MVEPTCQIEGLEDIYNKYLDDWGVFVEIGAYDGKTYSNTYHLACDGWQGVYAEPINHLYHKCVNNHKEHSYIDVWPLAISNKSGQITLFEGPDIYTNSKLFQSDKTITVPCLTLDTFIKQSLGSSDIVDLDLLVIDVEFHEKEVLQGFTLEKWKPKMVIIEAHEHHENPDFRINVDFINDYFKDYKKVYSDSINNIYVRD